MMVITRSLYNLTYLSNYTRISVKSFHVTVVSLDSDLTLNNLKTNHSSNVEHGKGISYNTNLLDSSVDSSFNIDNSGDDAVVSDTSSVKDELVLEAQNSINVTPVSFVDDTEHDNLMIYHPESFSLIHDTDLLVSDSVKQFDEQVRVKSKYTVPTSDYQHFKSKEVAIGTLNDNKLYSRWHASKDLYKVFIRSIISASTSDSPISESHLRDLQKAFEQSEANRASPIFSVNPSGYCTVAKAAYGMSHGLYDLVHFSDSQWERFHYEYNYDTLNNSTLNTTKITPYVDDAKRQDTITFDNELRSFDSPVSHDLTTFLDSYSGFSRSSYSKIMGDLYEINGDVSVTFSNLGSSERRAIVTRGVKEVTFSDGFEIRNSVTEGLSVPLFNDAIIIPLGSLFLMENMNIDDKSRSEIVNYVSSLMFEYVRSNVKMTNDTMIVGINVSLDIVRKKRNTELIDYFKSIVRSGYYVPMAPMQYKLYMDGVINDEWMEFIFLSGISNPRCNPRFNTLLPYMSSIDKREFTMYAIDRKRLQSINYESDMSLPFQKEMKFHIGFNDFIKEMFVRTMLLSDVPDYFLPITLGRWKGYSSSSVAISPARLHPIVCKLSLDDEMNSIDNYIKDILFDNSNYSLPYYIRRTTRLCEYLPNIYARYVPVSESVIINDFDDDDVL